MATLIGIVAVLIGAFGVFIYFQSIVRVMLLNRREPDIIERCVRSLAVKIVHALAGGRHDYEDVQRAQAWILPIFIFLLVTSWFLLVQTSFSLVLWGLHVEEGWPRAFSSSGSALSTLGYLTPSTLLGEYLAVYEAAIGLAIVILIFTFVPGYQAAIQARERKVGWLFARTGRHPNCVTLLEALKKAGPVDDPAVWEDWENWFRGIHETHSLSPMLAYVPSVYRGTSWVGASAAVLDTASVILSTLDSKQTDAVRVCRETGVTAIRLIATELDENRPGQFHTYQSDNPKLIAGFDALYDKLVEIGLPVREDKEQCRNALVALRSEYEKSIHHIAASTLMPVEVPWVVAHANTAAMKGTS
ncbi:hypothetical protein [Mesorhizobium sp. ANAO-SY3R2]|uniref:hypothetical protein n=1 Tax=Mesorhizobium sp. ANAO-SY3R2 TaxID=3166644 RepID=UPI00366AFBDF